VVLLELLLALHFGYVHRGRFAALLALHERGSDENASKNKFILTRG
jgi:hypothetical protein